MNEIIRDWKAVPCGTYQVFTLEVKPKLCDIAAHLKEMKLWEIEIFQTWEIKNILVQNH